jgi:crotonobetainyl-CoA:carnitine CoA-transferase CaiB-like acyl-CoA transferase
MDPLRDTLVVDLTRYLPGAFASRELLRLGARVVRVESPEGDPIRRMQPAWHDELNAGKESVVCDLKVDATLGRALCESADVVLESFRPGVADRLGLAPGPRTVWCSITGFGSKGRHARRAGHDLNYLGWAGVLGAAVPPVTVADYAGAFAAVREVLAGLLERERTGRGARREVSMTHESHGLAVPPLLQGTVACYRLYATADQRLLTVAALEPKFWQRLCELVELPELVARQWEPRLPELESAFASRSLAEWLELFDGEDVSVGPVATLEEGAAEFASGETLGPAPRLGEHTDAWRAELGL